MKSNRGFREPIDLVYLWVDGSDTEWQKKKQSYLQSELPTESVAECRARDNNELKFSLRSVEKHLPWINKIYIVTDNQIPKWLDTNNPKIKVVFHQDIIPKEFLPTFNSSVIELYMHKIPGLSEHFLYANDDMFVNCDLKPEFFFEKEGVPIIRLQNSNYEKIAPISIYPYMVLRMQKLVEEKFGKLYTGVPHHNIDSYTKKMCQECENEFKNEYIACSSNRFRAQEDMHRSLISYYALATGQAKYKMIPRAGLYVPIGTRMLNLLTCKYHIDSKSIGLEKKPLEKRFFGVNPKLFCINDTEKVNGFNQMAEAQLLQKLFPKKSSFELPSTLISVIIPVYNTEKYIEKCLNSLVNQTLKDIEIICVDDGSTDNSVKIIQKYTDKRIKIINQENQGVSVARNNGIKAASGEYIVFVDSDDWLEPDACEKMYNNICGCDVLFFSHYDIFPNKKKKFPLERFCKLDYQNFDNLDDYAKNAIYLPCIAVNKLYRRDFIIKNNIMFPKGVKVSEDLLFQLEVFSKKPAIRIIYEHLYNYLNVREASALNHYDFESFKPALNKVFDCNLYKEVSNTGKMYIFDRVMNYYCWMWKKCKNKRDELFQNLMGVMPVYDSFDKELVVNLRNYKKLQKIIHSYQKEEPQISVQSPKTYINNKISAIIPTMQKNKSLLINLVKNLESDDAIGEIIIINNTNKELNIDYPKVKCINPGKNLFVNKSWNIGVEKSCCEYFMLINDDLILPTDFCTKLLPLLSKDKGLYGMSESSIIGINDKTTSLSNNINLKETSEREWHFGCIMAGHYTNYYPIPEDLKIFCGDDYIFYKNIQNGKQNYSIVDCKIKHCHELTSGSTKFERIKYKDCQNYLKINKNFIIPPSYRTYNYFDKIIGLTNVTYQGKKQKCLILFGNYIKIGEKYENQ